VNLLDVLLLETAMRIPFIQVRSLTYLNTHLNYMMKVIIHSRSPEGAVTAQKIRKLGLREIMKGTVSLRFDHLFNLI
jgi:hypothetical protein